MQIFVKEDHLESVKIHIKVYLLEFGILLVFFKGYLPVCLGQRRDDAHNRTPLNHGQARVSQARDTSKQNHPKNNECTQREPARDPAVVKICRISVHGTPPSHPDIVTETRTRNRLSRRISSI